MDAALLSAAGIETPSSSDPRGEEPIPRRSGWTWSLLTNSRRFWPNQRSSTAGLRD